MCGRYVVAQDGETLARTLDADWHGEPWIPSWNINPSDYAPVLLQQAGSRWLEQQRWGLCVPWAKAKGIELEPFNARGEEAATKPFFRSAFRSRRCLLPSDGLYEWKGKKGSKLPYRIHDPEEELLTFAGVWEEWTPRDAEPVRTFAILTVAPNDVMRPIHDRMPVILASEDRDAWLDRATSVDHLQSLMRPYQGRLEAYRVPLLVNSPRNNGPELIERVPGL
jgi:putative SOS response-associated peptidase YedK